MPDIILTAKPLGDGYGSKSLIQLASAVPKCMFSDVWKKDKGTLSRGDWQKALIQTPGGGIAPSRIQQQNVNDWLKHIPCVIIPKGTMFLHVSAQSDWVTRSVVGGNAANGYSFFTSDQYGFAATHSNNFSAHIKMRLRDDVHAFFLPDYSLLTRMEWSESQISSTTLINQPLDDPWVPGSPARPVTHPNPGERLEYVRARAPGSVVRTLYRERVNSSTIDLGATLVRAITDSWPADFRPALIIGNSECEFIFHNQVLYKMLQTVGVATSANHFDANQQPDRRIVRWEELPSAPQEGITPGLASPPVWMGPKRADLGHVKRLTKALATGRAEDRANIGLFQ